MGSALLLIRNMKGKYCNKITEKLFPAMYTGIKDKGKENML